jgi:GntR family transcriptional repressor for pyruvate dehydrogenase complex
MSRHGLTRTLKPIDRSGITELVVERIKELLEKGDLRAGSRLPPERELAGLLHISRPSLRTALKALSVMGIINARPGAGTFIADSGREIFHQPMQFMKLIHNSGSAELFEARRIVEIGLVDLAAQRATPTQIKAIGDELEAMRQSVRDPEKFLEHDVRFHRAIAHAAGNTVMSGVMDTLTQMLFEARRQTIRTASDFDAAISGHEAIFAAIITRDAQRARERMFQHLMAAERGWNIQREFSETVSKEISRSGKAGKPASTRKKSATRSRMK